MRRIDDPLRNFYKKLGLESILLIDGDPWNRDSLSMFFRVVGCRIRPAANAVEAIAAMSGDRFDLILCEYHLPDMNGFILLKRYGNYQAGAVKFIITPYPDKLLVDDAARFGIHEVIRKPFTVDTLEGSLKRHFPRVVDRGGEPVGVE
ncbi:MAG TPA: hypothetical protein DDX05_02360 [Deltaproteobacteria bacterium]|nr:hypothetical protein [Deltaproteobacteria bacterium]HBG72474.1 hypothetical protein [Deltaproteobacteria bacterium]